MKKLKVMVQALAVVCLAALMLGYASPTVVQARTPDEIQAEINAKKEHLDSLEAEINASQSDKAAAKAALAEYEKQYNELLALVEEKEVAISHRESEVGFKTEQISITIESINKNRDQFAKRMLAIYNMNSSNAMLSALLAVESYSDLIVASDAMQRISRQDTQMLENLSADLESYEQQRVDLEAALAQLDAELADLQADKDWCNAKMTEMQGLISIANKDIANNLAESERTEAEVAALQQELARVFAQQEAKSSQAGDTSVRYDGPLSWPVSGGGKVTSWFGDPRSNTGYHYGIDITAGAGTPILAAASGTVITAEWHYSYGYYIVIDHGQGLRTLYAHCNELWVGAGAYVETGAGIAAVGSTGDSYGNHLHFEVHENGTRQNPAGSAYLNIS